MPGRASRAACARRRRAAAVALAIAWLVGVDARADATVAAGSIVDVDVEVPAALRASAGHATSAAQARVRIVIPARIDASRAPPVLLVSATADAGGNSSRRLLDRYADIAATHGWIAVAADAAEPPAERDDTVSARLVLGVTALAALATRWPETATSPLAFAGFSGGAKFAGWLAAAFARQGRTVIGLYQAGINEDTLLAAATRFDVLDARLRHLPVFLQSGRRDDIATPMDHRAIAAALKKAGFDRVRVVSVDGGHQVDAAPLADALEWFVSLATSDAAGAR